MIRTITPSELEERLTRFEAKYHMTTAEFLRALAEREGDSETGLEPWERDFIDWAILARVVDRLEN